MRLHEIATRPIPTRSFAKLFHVGTMNIKDKRRGSYEGAGLSVSLHPEEWMHIARIGGPVWECVRPGNRFLDFYRLKKAHKAIIAAWAIEQGLAQQQSMWKVRYYDDEAEERRYFSFTDETQARDEAEDIKSWATKPVAVTEIPGAFVGTPALYTRMMQDRSDPADAEEFITIAYTEDVLKMDGVWFNETLDADNLSAPRGVIVPSMITHWQFTRSGGHPGDADQ